MFRKRKNTPTKQKGATATPATPGRNGTTTVATDRLQLTPNGNIEVSSASRGTPATSSGFLRRRPAAERNTNQSRTTTTRSMNTTSNRSDPNPDPPSREYPEAVAPIANTTPSPRLPPNPVPERMNYPNGLLYSTPTVDSLGDEESFRNNSRYGGMIATPRQQWLTPHMGDSTTAQPQNHTRRKRRRRRRRGGGAGKEFQIPEDWMGVDVRRVPVAERSAFGPTRLPTISTSSSAKSSPSPQQVWCLHRMHSQAYVRQLVFSPSCGNGADVLYPGDPSQQPGESKNNEQACKSTDEDGVELKLLPDNDVTEQEQDVVIHDGRYRAIDPQQATLQALLPMAPPLLSNRKHRLPTRADVGFPHPSAHSIEAKQLEIRQETQWEEASPRLIVLVTSDDLGIVATETDETTTKQNEKETSAAVLPPHAGPDLLQAIQRNRDSHQSSSSSSNSSSQQRQQQRDRYRPLAPPLDAFYSTSMGWRPRPFHDRPPGRIYHLVYPQVHLTNDNSSSGIEPLVGCLNLYSLTGPLIGKASEDFTFPIGGTDVWGPHQRMDSISAIPTQKDEWMTALLKKKAIFAHDPLMVATQNLHVVLQVYKVPHAEFAEAYLDHSTSSPSFRQRSSSHQDQQQQQRTKVRSTAMWEQYGSRFLSPLCFGVVPLQTPTTGKIDNSTAANAPWPRGQEESIPLHLHPQGISQDDFVSRLQNVLSMTVDSEREEVTSGSCRDLASSDASTTKSTSTSTSSSSTQKRKGLVGRFLSPKKGNKKDTTEDDSTSPPRSHSIIKRRKSHVIDSQKVVGSATMFISALGVDFLQVLLESSQGVQEEEEKTFYSLSSSTSLPKIMVDISGAAAIMMNPNEGFFDTASAKKRSSLVRLPSRSAGYADASEYREVLFLPPRPPKQYPVDLPASCGHSTLNLLYLYPRSLKLENAAVAGSQSKHKKYTLRIQLMQNEADTLENTTATDSKNVPLEYFHNPVPWGSTSAMAPSVYTKLPCDMSGIKTPNIKSGVVMDDEFKLSLPMVLEGHYFLHFTLFVAEANDGSDVSIPLALSKVAGTAIPLNSSSRDSQTGTKSTTVIPNGNHRLKLGDFVLQLETRLLSSLHVSDTAVGVALREFPSLQKQSPTSRNGPIAMTVATKKGSDPGRGEMQFRDLIAIASGSALTSQFQTILFLHMSNLISSSGEITEKFLVDNIMSFLKVCSRVKNSFVVSYPNGELLFDSFLKATLEAFDEEVLLSNKSSNGVRKEDAMEVLLLEHTHSNLSANNQEVHLAEVDDEMEDDDYDGGAVRRRPRDSLMNDLDIRINRTFSAMENKADKSFSRTAYGATKMDRMRLEAELDTDKSRFTHLADDDDTTVATAMTAEARMAEAREAFQKHNVQSPVDFEDDKEEKKSDQPNLAKTFSDLALGERVRSAARVVLAPCVTPGLATVFNSTSSRTEGNIKPKVLPTVDESSIVNEDRDSFPTEVVGSDLEDDGIVQNDDVMSLVSSAYHTSEGTFRSPWHCPQIRFSIMLNQTKHLPLTAGDSLYESILVFWIREWINHVETNRKVSFLSLLGDAGSSLYQFFRHIDVLLPICLKSIVIRYGQVIDRSNQTPKRIIVDQGHMSVLDSFVEMIALSLLAQATGGRDKESGLSACLKSIDHVVDFFVGLLAVLHPAHLADLFGQFFSTLRSCEVDVGRCSKDGETPKFEWTEVKIHQVRCCRLIRLRVTEKLACLPNFVALNYPQRYEKSPQHMNSQKVSWIQQDQTFSKRETRASDKDDLIPRSGWLATILTEDALTICAHCCEAVVAEAIAHSDANMKSTGAASSETKNGSLNTADMLMFQSLAIHAITCVHELLLRRHAMDRRFQKDTTRERIAALFTRPIIEKSLHSVRWLSRLESTHKIRSLWLLCFVYILQEAPETLLREMIGSFNSEKEVQVHRFIRLLRLSSSTFQGFIDQRKYCMFPSDVDCGISPWLLQESFNTICATTILVVDGCVSLSSSIYPIEQKKSIRGILDLLLHILTTPQSSVTHLRALGSAIQALEKFGASTFLEISDSSLQHWMRVVLGLMNSTALSVRSIAVDFMVSLLGSVFEALGNIDELAVILATVLPEVAAREVGLFAVEGYTSSMDQIEQSVWPLRRSFADLEDANPLDDDRVDPQLSPILSVFCRACQAIIDGVLIELRLQGQSCTVVGFPTESPPIASYPFDADEESLFEAASFFSPETAPIQRIRWLTTLKTLHQSKGQWIEAAETLIMCAETVSDSIPHLNHVWCPSTFTLWFDMKRSKWLSTVGSVTKPEVGNRDVMEFASNFLQPTTLFPQESNSKSKSIQPTVPKLCSLLASIAKEAVQFYLKEGLDGLAYSRLESLTRKLMGVVDAHGVLGGNPFKRNVHNVAGNNQVDEDAALRRALASVSGDMTKLAERMLLIADESPQASTPSKKSKSNEQSEKLSQQFYVAVVLSGKKPSRFTESATLPPYLEWDTPSICRVPRAMVEEAIAGVGRNADRFEEALCSAFCKPLKRKLVVEAAGGEVLVRLAGRNYDEKSTESSSTIDVSLVQMSGDPSGSNDVAFGRTSKRFVYRKANEVGASTSYVELTVVKPFPCPLSRQRTLLTSEFTPH